MDGAGGSQCRIGYRAAVVAIATYLLIAGSAFARASEGSNFTILRAQQDGKEVKVVVRVPEAGLVRAGDGVPLGPGPIKKFKQKPTFPFARAQAAAAAGKVTLRVPIIKAALKRLQKRSFPAYLGIGFAPTGGTETNHNHLFVLHPLDSPKARAKAAY